MKRWLILLILVFPIVNAENYDAYKDLTLNLEINSELNAIANQGAKLETLSADLKLFPKNGLNQEVLFMDIFSNPMTVIENKESITYIWNQINNKYAFGLKAKLKVKNERIKVKSKIQFPYDFNREHTEYVKESEFIDINEDIRKKANEILKGETDYYVAVYKASEWVKNNIEYDLNTLTAQAVKKSSWVLENKQGVCDELTNLFISMLRSVGIPARFVTGMVYTNLDDGWGNHGWAEVYFPEKGWVPWDVTYGQFGWIDPSHIKLGDSIDSGESSIEYHWKSSNLDISAQGLNLKASLSEKGTKFDPLVKLQIKPLDENIKFGSYLLIGVLIENLQDNYLSDNIILIKGPKVEENVKNVLLKPKEVKSVYWISKIPEDLDKNYVYTSVLEVRDVFSSYSKGEVFYSENGRVIDLDEAKSFVSGIEQRDKKEILSEVIIDCDFEERDYYSQEEIDIICKTRNSGNVLLENLNFCIEGKCFMENLGIGETKEFSFKVNAKESTVFVVENNEFIKKENIEFSIVRSPTIYITELSPAEVNYNAETDVRFFINSDFEAKNVLVQMRGIGEITYNNLIGKKLVEFSVNSKKLVSGLNLKISYEDSTGKKYIDVKNYPIVVKNVPFYARWLGLLTGLF